MATLTQRLADLTTRIATECKSIRTLINGNAADLSALTTTSKVTLVSAINEVKALAGQAVAASGAQINDAATSSTTQTYSIDKIHSEITLTATATRDAILGGAGAAYDTLKELQDLLTGEASQISDIMTALGNRVRTDVANQGLTEPQKVNARTNIDVFSKAEIGTPDTDFVSTFTSGLT